MNDFDSEVTMAGGERTLLAGRYRIVRQLGQGGMGSVWLVEDTALDNKLFAIKMLPSVLIANKRALAQLKAEALTAMKLAHPNIVTLRAFEENGGNPFLVMDYVEGQTLDDYLAERGTLTEAETVELLKPIAVALDYAHGEGIIHRDIKPANIMIRNDGHPYILDFGIAREMQETLTRVTGKLSSGTLMYMSPEQLNGEATSTAQDVYSFAAMAYECLKGETPFAHGQIEFQIINKTPAPLPDGIAIAPSVMRGLAKIPGGRPGSCMEVLTGKQTALAVRPAPQMARPVEPAPQPVVQAKPASVRDTGRSAGGCLVIIIVMAVLAFIAGVWFKKSCFDPAKQYVANLLDKNESVPKEPGRKTCPTCRGNKQIKETVSCSHCGGSGRVASSGVCQSCNGTGRRSQNYRCSVCNGSGQSVGRCGMCGGNGRSLCSSCSGSGKVVNPTAVVGGIVNIIGAARGRGGNIPTGSQYIACSSCRGNGYFRCSGCNGSGQVYSSCRGCGGNGQVSKSSMCNSCGGSGRANSSGACPHCKKGKVQQTRICPECNGQGAVWR